MKMHLPSPLEPGRAFIIAEIGLNHNGDFDLAVRTMEEAAEAGADAVKFQNYRTEDFIADRSLTFSYTSNGHPVTETMWDLCKRCEMPREWLPKLKARCDQLGVVLLSTPTSEEGVQDLVQIGVSMLKNGSDYLSHLPLLRDMGRTGLPVILSTGMAYQNEIQESIDAVRAGGSSPVILLHCTSVYPTPPSDVNLRRMTSLRDAFGLPVGFSDHAQGSAAAVQAVTLGACVLEKHFTHAHDLPGPDHWFSMEPKEFKQYVDDVRQAEARLGSAAIQPAAGEKNSRDEFRLSLVAARDLPQGHVLGRSDFVIAKPGLGLPPKEAEGAVGRTLARLVPKGAPIKAEHFQ